MRWAFAEGGLSAAFTLATTLIAARFIAPGQFGEAALVIATSSIAEAIFLNGVTNTFIRAPTLDTRDTDALFCLTLSLGLTACLLCGALAVPLSLIFDSPTLIQLMLVQSLTCILAGLVSVPTVILSRKMRTRALAVRTLGQKITTLVVTAGLAWQSAGAWAVILGGAAGMLCGAITMIGSLSRRPRLRPAWKTHVEMMRLSCSVTLEVIAGMITPRLVMLLFGAFHGIDAAGCLHFAVRLVDELSSILKTVVNRTALPLFGIMQRKGGDAIHAFQTGARLICLISSPVLMGVAAVAPVFVPLFFGDHWVPAVYSVQVVAFTWAIAFTRVLIGPLLLARGVQAPQTLNSWLALALGLAGVILSAPITFPHVSWAYAAPVLGSIPSGLYLTSRIGGIPFGKQLQPVIGPLAFSLIMAMTINYIGIYILHNLGAVSSLAAQIGVGLVLYSIYLALFNSTFLREILSAGSSSKPA